MFSIAGYTYKLLFEPSPIGADSNYMKKCLIL